MVGRFANGYRMCHEYCTRTVHSGTVVHRQVPCLNLYAIVILFDSSAPASLSHQHSSAQPNSRPSPSQAPVGIPPEYTASYLSRFRRPLAWWVRVSVWCWLVCLAALF